MKCIIFSIILFATAIALSAAVDCKCGSHADGIVVFQTANGDCCNETPHVNAVLQHYQEQYPDVWIHTGNTPMSGEAAQSRCCP